MINPDFIGPDDDEADEECANCGGEGVVYCCEEEFACVDPEGGCDLCARRCDWCSPARVAMPNHPQKGK